MSRFEKSDYPLAEIRRHLETGTHRAGHLRLAGRNQHHDHGLAPDDAIQPCALWLLHLRRQPQLRVDTPQSRVRDQRAHG